MRKIGIMGGTFDPIHNGHIMLGRQAYAEYNLDEVWYMPSGQPPHKKGRHVTESAERCHMVKLAIQDIPYFVFSDFEVRRTGKNTYTAETLALLGEKYPDVHFYFIVGADSLFEIEKWYHPEEVMARATLMAAHREYGEAVTSLERHAEYLRKKYGADILPLHRPELAIASEDIRKMAGENRLPGDLLPRAVADYIAERGLYTDEATKGGNNQ